MQHTLASPSYLKQQTDVEGSPPRPPGEPISMLQQLQSASAMPDMLEAALLPPPPPLLPALAEVPAIPMPPIELPPSVPDGPDYDASGTSLTPEFGSAHLLHAALLGALSAAPQLQAAGQPPAMPSCSDAVVSPSDDRPAPLTADPSEASEPARQRDADALYKCSLCSTDHPSENYGSTTSGVRARMCRECTSLCVRANRLGLKVGDVRRAMEDGTLDKVLPRKRPFAMRGPKASRAAEPVPEGHRPCALCCHVYEDSHFGSGGRGKRCGYCRKCQTLLVRANRRGVKADELRTAIKDGTVETLLPAARSRTSLLASEGAARKDVGEGPEGTRYCTICEKWLDVPQFDEFNGKLRSYCRSCHCIVGRANKRGVSAADVRNAMRNGSLAALLPEQKRRTASKRRRSSVGLEQRDASQTDASPSQKQLHRHSCAQSVQSKNGADAAEGQDDAEISEDDKCGVHGAVSGGSDEARHP